MFAYVLCQFVGLCVQTIEHTFQKNSDRNVGVVAIVMQKCRRIIHWHVNKWFNNSYFYQENDVC